MMLAGSRAFSCCIPSRAQFTYPPYHSPTEAKAAMTPASHYYSPPAITGYYHPVAIMYPTTQYGGTPNKQCKGCGKFDDGSQVMLPGSTTDSTKLFIREELCTSE